MLLVVAIPCQLFLGKERRRLFCLLKCIHLTCLMYLKILKVPRLMLLMLGNNSFSSCMVLVWLTHLTDTATHATTVPSVDHHCHLHSNLSRCPQPVQRRHNTRSELITLFNSGKEISWIQ